MAKKDEVLVENEKIANQFAIKDEFGSVEVNPADSELHVEDSFSKFEHGEDFANDLNFNIRDFIKGQMPTLKQLGLLIKSQSFH